MRTQSTHPHAWLALPLALAFAACFGTSTGNPTEDGGGSENGGTGVSGYCKEASSRPVQVDEQTSLGFSAQQALAFVEGTQQETLTWHPQQLANYGPESGEHQLTITVTRRDTPIRLVQYRADTGGAEIGLAGSDCSDALAIDVHVALRTDGGALDEDFDTTLTVRSARKVGIYKVLKPEELGGSFEITQFHQPRYRLAQLNFGATFTTFGSSGTLGAVFEQPSADGTAIGSAGGRDGPLASWGPASCGPWGGDAVPIDEPVASFSGNDVLALLAAVDTVNVAWSGTGAGSASFAFALNGGVCAQLEADPFAPGLGGVGALVLRGVLDVQSQDGRIDAAWPVQVNAVPTEAGALEEVRITFDDERVPQQGSVQARYGVSGIDGSAYDWVGAGLALTLSPAGALAGELRVTGYTNPNCSTEPIRDQNGNIVGSPGCMGATPTQLAQAQFSTP